MATRNRTILFKKYRDAIKSVKAPMNGFAPSQSQSSRFGEGPVIELSTTSFLNPNRKYAPLSTDDPGTSSGGAVTVGLPPSWVDVSEEITANIQRVRVKMTELAKAHGKALMPSFGDVKDDQRRIEYFTQEITDLLRNSEKKLHKLSASGPSEDSNLRKNVQRSLATDLQSLSVELRKKQSMYLKRLQQQKEGSDGIDLEMNVNGGHFKEEGDEFDGLELSEHQMAKMRQSEAFTVEREREIQQVVDSVNELAQIMKDLSVLVIDQGTIVDRIDHNIENVSVSVEEGLKELEKAERSQKKGGMVTCATVLVIMCFVMVILLIIKSILF